MAGLRREEVAALSGVGLTWYTWLEQGREINVSVDALRRISRGLRLSTADVAYVFSLMDLPVEEAASTPVDPQDLRLLVDGYRWPAAVLSPLLDVVVANQVMKELYGVERGLPPFEENHLWQLMVNPERQKLLVDYDRDARHFAALFRLTAAAHVGSARFIALRDALLAESALFREVWRGSQIDAPVPRSVRLRHARYGDIAVYVTRTPLAEGQTLFLLSPTDADSEEKLSAI